MCWLPTGCALTARQRPKSACRLATSGAYARTIGLRIRINRLDGASGRCSVSNRPDQPNASCLFTPPSKTRSTSNAISHPAARSASSATKRSGRGEPPPRLEPELRLPIFTRPKSSSRDSAVEIFIQTLFRLPGPIESQFLVSIRKRAARQTDFHDVVVEVGDLRPALPDLGGE